MNIFTYYKIIIEFTINELLLPTQFATNWGESKCNKWVKYFDVLSLNKFISNWDANESANRWMASSLGMLYFVLSKVIFIMLYA